MLLPVKYGPSESQVCMWQARLGPQKLSKAKSANIITGTAQKKLAHVFFNTAMQ
jgi:hypothetical protein